MHPSTVYLPSLFPHYIPLFLSITHSDSHPLPLSPSPGGMAVSIPLPSTPEEGGGALLAEPSSDLLSCGSGSMMSDDAKTIRELKEMLTHSMAAREKVEASKMVSEHTHTHTHTHTHRV